MRLLLPAPPGLPRLTPLPVPLVREPRADAVGRERVPGAWSAGWSDLRGGCGRGCDARVHLSHIPEDSTAGTRAAATAIVSAAASAGLSIVADVSPNTARLLGDSPWELLRSIGVARVRIDFAFSVAQTHSIATVLPIALNASTLRAADCAPFVDIDVGVELMHNSTEPYCPEASSMRDPSAGVQL
ncbi:MupG family TIM beta-alpha barrel fold protein [Curtobacterium flaccumfaciens pv. flaccumfaciens]|uniref:MupG family TIM beta-alpha barrel fold protein n=1 Tax=Curtobacterium poinsettiae TaxID=159612 RepID=UPI00217D1F79|nr:MupG family TIM beta-alpha barrel fold protein [Curtobacterium flaccumfaciens]MCS6575640.1 MupG family TIM beta-alpha barrel fold protein [Curtobacterium flaccumfaciens pv. flaccumfaciens]